MIVASNFLNYDAYCIYIHTSHDALIISYSSSGGFFLYRQKEEEWRSRRFSLFYVYVSIYIAYCYSLRPVLLPLPLLAAEQLHSGKAEIWGQ